MPIDLKRSILGDLKKPLIQPTAAIPVGLEQKLLGADTEAETVPPFVRDVRPPATEDGRISGRRGSRARVPTVPVTFHLPIDLRDRVKLNAQARQKTMLEIAIDAFSEYLEKYPVSESDLRKLLGL